MLTHKIKRRVEWGDCDPAGRVYYPRLFEWVNPSCHDMLDSGGLYHDVMSERYGLRGVLLKSVNMDFQQPAFLGDDLEINSTIARIGTTSFAIAHTVRRGEDLIATGDETRLWVLEDPKDPKRVFAERIPDEVRAVLTGKSQTIDA